MFKFVLKSSYVRLVPKNPAKMGLCNLQGTIILKYGLHFFYLKMYAYFTPGDATENEMQ